MCEIILDQEQTDGKFESYRYRFCSFFSTVANKLKTKVLQIKDFVWAMPVPEHRKTYNQFRFKQVNCS